MTRFADLVSQAAREMGSLPNLPDPDPNALRLDSNENPFGPSPRALEAMRSALDSSNFYPDDDCRALRGKLAASHDLPPEQVLVTPGSTGMLSLLCQTLLTPERNAVTSERSFIVYRMVVRAAGSHLIEVPMRADAFDLDAILRAITPGTRLVFLPNPNNPTGTMTEAGALDDFLAQVPDHVVVVLDEAYREYAQPFAQQRGIEYPRALSCLARKKNVVILRTFSKVHGLAGLRIGYGMGSADLLGYCARIANTYSVSSMAQAAALAALEDQEHIAHAVSSNTEQAGWLSTELGKMGFRTVPTSANFVYFDVTGKAAELAERLSANGVSVRPLAAWGAPHSIRATVGTPEQNRRLIEALSAAKNI
ncbi:MAG TPA: histidinol-phosphate transaminase [Candidatus Sulfotelmatobacter sp.]|nr:histidinol-phosphate transaminase [Candidatus Sulfotelmatobacter sp.]